jgi:peptidoglycan/LPS O-acetylase OafA/YrhL
MKLNKDSINDGRYRPDIDGLRAIAILIVVIFHYFPFLIPGGYIGVDIFFVISGYLITKIIYPQIEKNNFSFIDFYERRVKRIFPALIVVLLFSIILGKVILLKDEYQNFKDSVFYASTFFSNYGLYKESGYFDTSSDSKPLLHLWSLAIEMQFYILWPIILLILARVKKYSILAINFILLLSFILCILQTYKNPTLAFYNPLARGWELIIGGLVFLNEIKRLKASNYLFENAKSILGLLLIFVSCMHFNKYSIFPGWIAIIPALGTYLILDSNKSFLNKHILSNKLFLALGLLSYSIYLWHWPLLVFTRIYISEMPTVLVRILLIVFVIFISYLTYKYVERPILNKNSTKKPLYILLILMMFVGIYSLHQVKQNKSQTVTSKDDFENYFYKNANQKFLSEFEKKFRHECNFYQIEKYYEGNPTLIPKDQIEDSCFKLKDNKKTILIWGDSHAQMLNSGLADILPDNWQILQIASSGCYPNVDFAKDSETNYCARSNWFATKFIKENRIDVVIIAQSSGHNLNIINYTVNKLLSFGVGKVVVMGPAPKWTDYLPKIILRQLWDNIPSRTFIGIDKNVLKTNTELKRAFINSHQKIYVDTIGVFCNSQGCLTSINDNFKEGLVSWDTGHLSEMASKYLANKIFGKIIDDE